MGVRFPIEMQNHTGTAWDAVVRDAQKAFDSIENHAEHLNESLKRSLVNHQKQTSAEWDKFTDILVNRIQKGGVDLDDILQQSSYKLGGFTKRFTQEIAGNTQQVGGLVDMVKQLNALNITPRGYEMTAYRLSGLVSTIGMWSVPLAGAAAGVVSVMSAVDQLQKTGDPAMQALVNSTERLTQSWDRAALALGKTDLFQSGIRGLTDSVETLTDISERGIPTLKGFWSVLTGDLEGARAAKREIDAINESIIATVAAANKKSAIAALDSVDSREGGDRRREEYKERYKTEESINEKIQERRQHLIEIAETGIDAKDFAKAEKEHIDEINDLLKRQKEIRKENIKAAEDAAKRELENQRAQIDFRQWQLEAQRQINREVAKELELKRHAALIERQRIEAQEATKFKNQLSQQLGGEKGMAEMLGGTDPRKVREAIAKGRDATVVGNMNDRNQRELEQFDANNDPMNLKNAAARDAIVKRQQRDMTRERQRSRAGAFRDFNKGNVDSSEMLEGQSQVMGQMIKDAAGKGKISAKTAEATQDLLDATRANMESNRQLGAEVNRLAQMAQATAEAAKAQAAMKKQFVN